MSIDRSIRLACSHCERDDMDGISPAELEAAIADGWKADFHDETNNDTLECMPDDLDLVWYTHMGVCPDCAKGART